VISFRLEAAFYLAAIVLAEFVSPWPLEGRTAALLLAVVMTARFVGQSLRHFRAAARVWPVLRSRVIELGLTAAALTFLVSKAAIWMHELMDPAMRLVLEPIYRQYAGAFLVIAGSRVVVGDISVRPLLYRLEVRPARTAAMGFFAAIVAGTVLLSLPVSVVHLEQLSLLDALFTATSAVTVSGLIVYDPGSFHTGFGQSVLLGLIQLGGIGTMAASASLVILAGRRLRLRSAAALQESMDLETVGHVRGQLRTIVGMTLAAEVLGALALYAFWRDDPRVAVPWFDALFHAVSAFCNAGFSTFSSGLVPLRESLGTNLVIAGLIVVGGLGFPVVRVLGHLAVGGWRTRQAVRLSLHARLALLTAGTLLVSGTLMFLLLEWQRTLAPLTWPSRFVAAGFLSVTARTAGFNTLDTAALAPATLWLLMLLMFVGGNPGSTAGGIKTTTFATVVATFWGTLRGRPHVEAFRRTIPDEQVTKALALLGISTAVIAAGVTALLATQAGEPLALVFEAVSAFGTVGLSTGVTSTLNGLGKTVIIGLMFVGRTGPLTLAFALAARRVSTAVTYPAEKVMIG
jgi:trk system potassium uptake protein TrkH